MVRDIYVEAADAYRKAIELSVTTQKVTPEVFAAAYDGLGQAFARTGDVKSAAGSFDEAAKAQPANAGMHYFNEAATLYNVYEENGKRDPTMAAAAEVAAEKAIAAQSTNPFAYYIKAEGLALRMTTAGGKYVAPTGLVEACNKYMELGSAGSQMDDVKEILAKLNEPVKARSRK
jgi:tetratricopeptide (TPR) repeat protein